MNWAIWPVIVSIAKGSLPGFENNIDSLRMLLLAFIINASDISGFKETVRALKKNKKFIGI